MFDRDYFEGTTKSAYGGYTLEKVYPRMKNIAEYFKKRYAPKRVLDVGCAKGFLVKAFADLGVDAIGIDVSNYVLAKSHFEVGHRVLCASAEKLPFSDCCFDFIFAIDLIEHLKYPKNFLLEAGRILTKKGKLCILTIGPKNPNATKDITHINVRPARYWYKLFKKCRFRYQRLYHQVGYPHIENAPYTILKKFKIKKLAQIFAIVRLDLEILHKEEYTFVLTKIKELKT